MKQDLQIQAFIRQIVQALLDVGLSKEDAGEFILMLDNEIYRDLTTQVTDAMSAEQIKEIENANDDEKVIVDQLDKIGINSEAIHTYYVQQLEIYLANLPKQLQAVH